MDLGLANAATVVVGDSRGMGLAAARRLADEGGRVALVGRSREAFAELVGCNSHVTGANTCRRRCGLHLTARIEGTRLRR